MQVYAYRDDPDEENDLASTGIGRKTSERCREMFRKIPFGYQMATNR
jgi:hypothetical protein